MSLPSAEERALKAAKQILQHDRYQITELQIKMVVAFAIKDDRNATLDAAATLADEEAEKLLSHPYFAVLAKKIRKLKEEP